MSTYAEQITRSYSDPTFYSANGNLMTEVTVTWHYPDAEDEVQRLRFSSWSGDHLLRSLDENGTVVRVIEIEPAVWSRMASKSKGTGALTLDCIREFFGD